MSIDIHWNRIVSEDHERISNQIRDFLDEQFQRMHLPSYIASVKVLAFDIGNVAPEIEIKHIGDPYPEFYEESEEQTLLIQQQQNQQQQNQRHQQNQQNQQSLRYRSQSAHGNISSQTPPSGSASTSTASMLLRPQPFSSASGSSNLQYFHSVLNPSLMPGLRSPLQNSFPNLSGLSASFSRSASYEDSEGMDRLTSFNDNDGSPHFNSDASGENNEADISLDSQDSQDSDVGDGEPSQLPDSPNIENFDQPESSSQPNRSSAASPTPSQSQPPPFSVREEDVQFLLHLRYHGDVKLVLTANLRVNYPAPEFLTLPLRLTVTGFEVDAMAVLTYISRCIHFSFISDVGGNSSGDSQPSQQHFEVLRNIKVESEIGDQVGKGAVLKNVGKVERFVLDRLRAIVRDEVAWPGWITFEF